MCGIVGYIGKEAAVNPVMEGLRALEYRGYDSAGISYIINNRPLTIKQVGRVEALKAKLTEEPKTKEARVAIGHTRWATHGTPTQANAHPHTNTEETIFVVHNGIIENYQDIKTRLKKAGYTFVSQTDTEVIPHLIDWHLQREKNFLKAFKKTVEELQGAYAIAALYAREPDKLYVAKLSSPLIIGVGNGSHFVASDPTAVMEHTRKVIFLNDYEIAEVTARSVDIHDIKQAVQVTRKAEELDYDIQRVQLGDFPDFMLKEIYEAPQTIQSATRGRIKPESNTVKLGGLESVAEQLRYIDRIVIVACGTSYYAGLVG